MKIRVLKRHVQRAIEIAAEYGYTPNGPLPPLESVTKQIKDGNYYLVQCNCPTSLALKEKLGLPERSNAVETFIRDTYVKVKGQVPFSTDTVVLWTTNPLARQIRDFNPHVNMWSFKPGWYELKGDLTGKELVK